MTWQVVGLGVDLVRVARFRRFLDQGKAALFERLFTNAELDYAMRKKDPAPHLAARFAAKEAFLKAMGTGLRHGISWQDMMVVHDDLGKPELRLRGRAAEIMKVRGQFRIWLSYSHESDVASATVILEGECNS